MLATCHVCGNPAGFVLHVWPPGEVLLYLTCSGCFPTMVEQIASERPTSALFTTLVPLRSGDLPAWLRDGDPDAA